MKKLCIGIFLFATCLFANQANASSYSVNEDAVDQLFNSAIETSMISTEASEMNSMVSGMTPTVMAQDKDAVVAIVLDFFLGGLGIHRFYLGTKTMTGIGYILTCGGIFGIVPLVDFVVLVINNEDISPYINNPKFFMWN